MGSVDSHPIVIVMLIATLAPLLAEIPVGVKLPVVVLEVLLGIVIGPSVLGLAEMRPGSFLAMMQMAGMAAVLFMAGMEIDVERVRGRPLLLGGLGWLLSVLVAFVAVALLHAVPGVQAPMMVTIALATTSLGVLLPMLSDSGRVDSRYGRYLLAAGTVGEVAPIVAVALLLSQRFSTWHEFGFLALFLAMIALAAAGGMGLRPPRVLALLERTMHSSTQLPIRLAILVLAGAYVLSDAWGLEGILGAFAAGMVIGLTTRGPEGATFRAKIEAVSFGWLSPFFFVGTGIDFELGALWQSVTTAVLVPIFILLFVAVRGAPAVLYRRELGRSELAAFALNSAVPSLSLVLVITQIGRHTQSMNPDIAQALIGAALISVLLFPTLAAVAAGRHDRTTGRAGEDAASRPAAPVER